GELVYTITGPDGEPVTDYQEAHEKEMHLIVVRTDGTQYRHAHPDLDPSTGTWSLPWQWEEAGTYKIYADFAPAGEGTDSLTLSRTVDVAGELKPVNDRPVSTTDEVDGFDVSVEGDLIAGTSSDLSLTVTQNGAPVATLEPYLGAYGHLVALRAGDMGYLHVHAEGDDPGAGETSGPSSPIAADAPTARRYFLYLDFQIDGQLPTAQFGVEAERGTGGESADAHPDRHRPNRDASSATTDRKGHAVNTEAPPLIADTGIELEIGGMTCASCANRIERKLNKLDGVAASVNSATEKAKVTAPEGYDPQLLVA